MFWFLFYLCLSAHRVHYTLYFIIININCYVYALEILLHAIDGVDLFDLYKIKAICIRKPFRFHFVDIKSQNLKFKRFFSRNHWKKWMEIDKFFPRDFR